MAADSIAVGIDPVDKTIIDVNGISVKVFDLAALGGAQTGQVVNPRVLLELKAKDVGQVFSMAFDNTALSGSPDLFLAATSKFGLAIVAAQTDIDGTPIRLKAGAPGARFMDGQFGGLTGAGPGTIYKIDGATGVTSVFANLVSDGLPNSGPGLGGLAVDPKTRSLFVSELETGLVFRLSLNDGSGTTTAQFDHGFTARPRQKLPAVSDDKKRLDLFSNGFKPDDNATWGLTPRERRIDALAVYEGRLYYSVAAGPEVWSVGITADGGFASDGRLETLVSIDHPAVITSIIFDRKGRMTIGLRGEPKSPHDYQKFVADTGGDVLRFTRNAATDSTVGSRWMSSPERYAVGGQTDNRGATGGVAFGYAYADDGSANFNVCNGSLIASGDQLTAAASVEFNGIEIKSADPILAATAIPATAKFADFDSRQNSATSRGHVGFIATIQRCDGIAAMPPVAEDNGGSAAPNVADNSSAAGSPANASFGAAGSAPTAAPTGQQPTDIAAPGAADQVASQNCDQGADAPLDPIVDTQVPVAPISAGGNSDASVSMAHPKCVQRKDVRDCTWQITVSNPGTTPFKPSVLFLTQKPATGRLRISDGATTQNIQKNDKDNPEQEVTMIDLPGGDLPSGAAKTFTVEGTFPLDPPKLSAGVISMPGGLDDAAQDRFGKDSNPSNNLVSDFITPDDVVASVPCANGDATAGPTTSDPTQPGEQAAQPPADANAPDADQAQAPPETPQSGPLTITKEAESQSCSTAKACVYKITLTNTGNQPIPGPFEVVDLVSADGDLSIKNVSTTPGPATTSKMTVRCDQTDPSIQCTVAGPIEPGPHVFEMTFEFEAGTAPATSIENCASISNTTNKSCVTVPFTQAPAPKLAIKKVATGCDKVRALNEFQCGYHVTITNNGVETFNGPIVLIDSTDIISKTNIVQTSGISCDTGGAALERRCEIKDNPILAGSSLELDLSSHVAMDAPGLDEIHGCKVKNTILIQSPVGEGPAPTSEATNELPIQPNKGGKVPCDPPALKLTKSAQGCVPSGDGFDCKFKLTATSIGPDPFQDGTVDIMENLPKGAIIKTSSSGCSGAGANAHCRQEHVTLPVNQSLDFDLTVAVPASSVPAGTCEIKNDARLVISGQLPTGTIDQNLNASATAKIDSPSCKKSVCQGGMQLTGDKCACASGMSWNGNSCAKSPTLVCPAGYSGTHPDCKQIVSGGPSGTQAEGCLNGMILVGLNRCGCPTPSLWNGSSCQVAPTLHCPPGYPECSPLIPSAKLIAGGSDKAEQTPTPRRRVFDASPSVGNASGKNAVSTLPSSRIFKDPPRTTGGAFTSNNSPTRATVQSAPVKPKVTGGSYSSNNVMAKPKVTGGSYSSLNGTQKPNLAIGRRTTSVGPPKHNASAPVGLKRAIGRRTAPSNQINYGAGGSSKANTGGVH